MASSADLGVQEAERHPGFRVGARFHADLSQPDRPHPARRAGPQDDVARPGPSSGGSPRIRARSRRFAAQLRHLAPRRLHQRRLRPDRRLGAGPLPFPRPPAARRLRRPALRPADRRRRHRADRALRAERLDRQPARAARHQGRLHAARHLDRAGLHRPALRRAHAPAGDGGARPRGRGGRRDARRRRAARPSAASSCRRCCRRSSPASRSPLPAPSANTARSSSSPAISRSSRRSRRCSSWSELQEFNYPARPRSPPSCSPSPSRCSS